MSVKYPSMNYKIAGGGKGPEYSRHYKIGSSLVIAGFLFSSCRPLDATASSDPTLTSTQTRTTEFAPTPTINFPPRIEGISPNEEEIRRLGGRFIGVGGSSDLVTIDRVHMRDLDVLHLEFLENSLSPVTGDLESNGYVLTTYGVYADGARVCFPALPERLYTPERPPEIGFPWLFANNLISNYGDQQSEIVRFKGIGAITLNGLPEDIVCVTAFVNKDNAVRNPATGEYLRAGTTLNVPVNIRTNEIYEGIPAIYAAEDNVEIDQGNFRVLVNGAPAWYMGDRMADLLTTPTPPEGPTATPVPTETQTPTSTPEIKPSDITDDVRLFTDVTFNNRVRIPFGVWRNPNNQSPQGEPINPIPGIQNYLLSGILLETPRLDNEGDVILKLGIPDSSGREFNVIYLEYPPFYFREADRQMPITPVGINLKGKGYALISTNSRNVSVAEWISLTSNAVGRQVAAVITTGSSPDIVEDWIDHSLAQSELCMQTPDCVARVNRRKEANEEAFRLINYIRNNDSRYDEQALLGSFGLLYFPVTTIR